MTPRSVSSAFFFFFWKCYTLKPSNPLILCFFWCAFCCCCFVSFWLFHSPGWPQTQTKPKFLQPRVVHLDIIHSAWLCWFFFILFTLYPPGLLVSWLSLPPSPSYWLSHSPLWTRPDISASEYALPFIYNKPPPQYLTAVMPFLFNFLKIYFYFFFIKSFHETTIK